LVKDITETLGPVMDRLAEKYLDAYKVAKEELDTLFAPYLAKSEPEKILLDSGEKMGLDLEAFVSRCDLYTDPVNKPGKTPHGYCSLIDPPYDVRAIANVALNPANRTMSELRYGLLHEALGHGLDGLFVDKTLPPQLRNHHSLSTEGQAIMFESLRFNEHWLHKVLGVPKTMLRKAQGNLNLVYLMEGVQSLRYYFVTHEFERALYKDPDQDMDACYTRLLSRFYLKDPKTMPTRGLWAENMHFANYPAYQVYYLLGVIWQAQVRTDLDNRFGGLLTPEAAEHLKRHRASGLVYSWDEQIQQLTGEPLKPAAMLNWMLSLEKTLPEDVKPPKSATPC
jgi:peptidyl-dipeptidase A